MRIFLIICSLVLCFVTSDAATVVTAVYTPHPNIHSEFHSGAGIGTDGPVFDNRLAQTFLATTSGSLVDVSFAGHYNAAYGVPTVPLRIDVTRFINGQPGDILASAYVPVDQFPTSMSFPAKLSVTAFFSDTSAQLIAGTTYAIVFRTESTEANYRISGGYQETLYKVPGYSDGFAMSSQNSPTFRAMSSTSDLFFQVRVDSVPEPSSNLLLGSGCVLIYGARRRTIKGSRTPSR